MPPILSGSSRWSGPALHRLLPRDEITANRNSWIAAIIAAPVLVIILILFWLRASRRLHFDRTKKLKFRYTPNPRPLGKCPCPECPNPTCLEDQAVNKKRAKMGLPPIENEEDKAACQAARAARTLRRKKEKLAAREKESEATKAALDVIRKAGDDETSSSGAGITVTRPTGAGGPMGRGQGLRGANVVSSGTQM